MCLLLKVAAVLRKVKQLHRVIEMPDDAKESAAVVGNDPAWTVEETKKEKTKASEAQQPQAASQQAMGCTAR